jgi:hypothetical protein
MNLLRLGSFERIGLYKLEAGRRRMGELIKTSCLVDRSAEIGEFPPMLSLASKL